MQSYKFNLEILENIQGNLRKSYNWLIFRGRRIGSFGL